MVNLNQLRVFYHVADQGRITAAAEKLHITQPAVTIQLKAFEESCEVKLYQKVGQKIQLTDEGNAIYEYAKSVFEYERKIDELLDDMRGLKRGSLRLGTTKTYSRFLLPALMGKFHEEYPHIKIDIHEGSSMDMIQRLARSEHEVVVIAKVAEHAKVRFVPFASEELVLILAPSHRLVGEKAVSCEDLADEPIIMREQGSGTRKAVDEFFAKIDFAPRISMQTDNPDLIKQLVQRGEGVSFLVKSGVCGDVEAKRLATVPLKEHKLFLKTYVAYLKDQNLSPSARAFIKVLEKMTPGDRPLESVDSFTGSDE